MNYRQPTRSAIYWRATALVALIVVLLIASTRLRADTETSGTCGGASTTIPFTDVPNTNIFFCAIAAAYFSGLTNGTSATTYSPGDPVPREQMAAFITRTLDQSLRRGSRRAALKQWWTPAEFPTAALGGSSPQLVESDGTDVWGAFDSPNNVVGRVEASSGRLKQVWVGATNAYGVVVAHGLVYVTGAANPGLLWVLNPAAESDFPSALLEANDLGAFPHGIAFDGLKIWTANATNVSIRSFAGAGSTQTVGAGFASPLGILYDGSHIWVADVGDDRLKKLNSNGGILQSIPVGSDPGHPVFDGMNIWVPNQFPNTVTVVRVKDTAGNPLTTPFVLATLTGNGLNGPTAAAFDGQRILVTNFTGNSVSLWKAADLTPIGSVSAGANSNPMGACSDGINFWITLNGTGRLARF